jgi:hypothetical protein
MSEITITLPIPDRALSPNARHGHFMQLARAKKAAKELAHVTAHNAMIVAGWPKAPKWEKAVVDAVVVFSGRRRRIDEDNLIASCKAYQDGIASAGLVANDRGIKWGGVAWIADKTVEPCLRLTFRKLPQPINNATPD